MLYDIDVSGHHIEYIEHILNYISNGNSRIRYVFLLSDAYEGKLNISNVDNCQFVFFDSLKFKKTKKLLFRTFSEVLFIKKTAEKHNVQDIIFMNIDPYQIALILFGKGFNFSGIMFSPPTRIEVNKVNIKTRLKETVRKSRKEITLKIFSRKSFVKTIFILNDEKVVSILNQENRNCFKYLPDPILPLKGNSRLDIRDYYKIDSESRVMLCFGSIIKRKNLERIIKAVININSENNALLLIVGKGEESYVKKLENLIGKPHENKIIIDNRFIPKNEIGDFFQGADFILMPYLNFYGSSGVLGHAMNFKKPVLCSNNGLISDIVEKFGLGISVEPLSVDSIKMGLSKLSNHNKKKEFKSFLDTHSPSSFAEILIQHNYL